MLKITALIAVAAFAGPASANDGPARDAAVKAAMVYNFARFAAWPPSRFPDAESPVTLCVASSSSLAPALEKLDGQPVGGRRLAVRLTTAPSGATCHLAYFDAESMGSAQLAALHQQGVLTVGEGRAFSEAGVLALVTVGRQVRFEANVRAARDAGVSISSHLLRLAVAVRS